MPIHLKLLFVIADGGHVRFVRPAQADNTLHSSDRPDAQTGHKSAAGQHDAATHHAQAPTSDPHGHEKAEFASWIAHQLNDAVQTYDELILVAPAHMMNVISKGLSAVAAAKLIGSLDKDLTKISDHDLSKHLKEWVRPVHREALL